MNLILEGPNAVPFYTELRGVFDALGMRTRDYDWFVST